MVRGYAQCLSFSTRHDLPRNQCVVFCVVEPLVFGAFAWYAQSMRKKYHALLSHVSKRIPNELLQTHILCCQCFLYPSNPCCGAPYFSPPPMVLFMLIILLDFFSTLGIFRIDIPFLSRAIQQSESILEGCFAVRDDAALFSWLNINRYLMTAKSSLIDIGVVILVVWWLCHDKRIRVVYGVVLAVCIISFNYGLMARAESSRILLYQ